MTGMFLFGFVFFLFIIILVSAGSSDPKTELEENSILHLTFDYEISDRNEEKLFKRDTL